MQHPEAWDLLPGAALGDLDLDERNRLEAHLVGCEACRAELARLTEAAAMLRATTAPVEPPASLRDRVLAIPAGQPARGRMQARARSRLRAWRPIAAAAAFAAVIALAAVVALNGSGDERRIELHGEAGETGVLLVGDSDGDSTPLDLTVDGLAQLPRGERYVVWFGSREARVPAGDLEVDRKGHAWRAMDMSDATLHDSAWIWITRERGQLDPENTGPTVVRADL